MDPSAIIGAGASLVTGAANAIVGNNLNRKNRDFYREMTDRQNAFNAEQAQIAYDRQRDLYDYQFNRESAYNDPVAQMSRLRNAGFSPALLAEGGSASAGSVAASPSGVGAASAASPNPPEFQNYFQTGLDSMMAAAQTLSQLKLNKATRTKTEKEADKIVSEKDLTDANKEKVIQETQNLAYTLKDILPTQYKQLITDIEQKLQDMENSQQITAATVNKMAQDILESVSRVNVNDSTNQKLQKELKGYSEYLQDVYRHEAYRADLDYENYEFAKNIRGLRSRFSDSLQNGDIMSAMKYGVLIFLMDMITNSRD